LKETHLDAKTILLKPDRPLFSFSIRLSTLPSLASPLPRSNFQVICALAHELSRQKATIHRGNTRANSTLAHAPSGSDCNHSLIVKGYEPLCMRSDGREDGEHPRVAEFHRAERYPHCRTCSFPSPCGAQAFHRIRILRTNYARGCRAGSHRKTLDRTLWVVAGPNGAASRLGVKRSTLYCRMQKLGISRARRGPIPEDGRAAD
jgi:hypothetical protein